MSSSKASLEEIEGFLGGDLQLSTEKRKNSSELRNLSSEVSFHSSELLFPGSVKKIHLLAGDFGFPTEGRGWRLEVRD